MEVSLMRGLAESGKPMRTVGEAPKENSVDDLERDFHALRSKLIFYFRHNGCADPKDLADETITRAYGRLKGGTQLTTKLSSYVFGVAHNVLREHWKADREVELNETHARTGGDLHALNTIEQSVLICKYLGFLPAGDQKLLRSYFWDDRSRVAEEFGLTSNSLRIRVCRILKQLREHVAGPAENPTEEP
jgi:DNA-directed RNA polymerase specialized sigma24 family protein